MGLAMMFRLALLLLLVLSISVLALPDVLGFDIDLPEPEDLDPWIDAAGLIGPILVVALMTVAIVASPLPNRFACTAIMSSTLSLAVLR